MRFHGCRRALLCILTSSRELKVLGLQFSEFERISDNTGNNHRLADKKPSLQAVHNNVQINISITTLNITT